MSELQDAIEWWKTNRVEPFDLSHDGQHAMTLIVEAARRVANLTFKPYQLLVGNWNPNLDEWEDIREATVDEVLAALGVTTEDDDG